MHWDTHTHTHTPTHTQYKYIVIRSRVMEIICVYRMILTKTSFAVRTKIKKKTSCCKPSYRAGSQT